jgi:hypothetical protein
VIVESRVASVTYPVLRLAICCKARFRLTAYQWQHVNQRFLQLLLPDAFKALEKKPQPDAFSSHAGFSTNDNGVSHAPQGTTTDRSRNVYR